MPFINTLLYLLSPCLIIKIFNCRWCNFLFVSTEIVLLDKQHSKILINRIGHPLVQPHFLLSFTYDHFFTRFYLAQQTEIKPCHKEETFILLHKGTWAQAPRHFFQDVILWIIEEVIFHMSETGTVVHQMPFLTQKADKTMFILKSMLLNTIYQQRFMYNMNYSQRTLTNNKLKNYFLTLAKKNKTKKTSIVT